MQIHHQTDFGLDKEQFEDYSFSFIHNAETQEKEDDNYRYPNAASCPDCRNGMVRLGGCFSCPACGFESCSI